MLVSALAAASRPIWDGIYTVFAIICVLCVALMLIGLFILLRTGSMLNRLDADEDWSTRRSRTQTVKEGLSALLHPRSRSRDSLEQTQSVSQASEVDKEGVIWSNGRDPLL